MPGIISDLYIKYKGAKQDFKIDWTETTKSDWKIDFELDVTPPVANFTFIVTDLSVNFTNTSTGAVVSRSWNFGDGTAVSTDNNPSHTFDAAGSYEVALTVTNSGGSHTVTKTVVVTDPV